MSEVENFIHIVKGVKDILPIVSDITKGEIFVDKDKTIIFKTRKKMKRESHLVAMPLKECFYIFKDVRSLTEKLEEIKELKDKGILTQEEYDKKKKELLERI